MTSTCSVHWTFLKRLRALFVGIFAILELLFSLPSTALAVDALTDWNLPFLNSNYAFEDDVVFTGTWTLPPDWLGNIYFYQDGVQMHDVAHPTADCSLSPAPAGCYFSITNINQATSLSGAFNFNVGPQPDLPGHAPHFIQVKFWGGLQCAVKEQINAVVPGSYPTAETCNSTDDNFNGGQIYPLRSYTVNQPLNPRFTVTPSTNPALDFGNVVPGDASPERKFYVHNSGQQTLNFTIAGVNPPYYCLGGSCAQAVAKDETKEVRIQFSPAVLGTFSAPITFTCVGAPLPCDVLNLTRNITGTAVGAALPPTVSVTVGAPLNFPFFYLGNPTYKEMPMTVKNVGGGLLVGEIFPPTDFTCQPIGPNSCKYSLFSGESKGFTIRFTPTSANIDRNDSAYLSDAGPGLSVNFHTSVSNTPVLRACVAGCPEGSMTSDTWNAGMNVNIGDHREINVYVQNYGGGNLTGVISGLPLRGFSFTPNGNYPYVGIPGGPGWTLIGKFNFDPSDALAADADVYFSNDDPLGGNMSVIHLHGQGNDQPQNGGGTTVLFGNVVLNTTKPGTLTVTNTGVGVLNVNLPTGVLANPAFSCVSNCSFLLGAGLSATINFSFTPTIAQPYSLPIVVGGTSVTLSGTGVLPSITVYALDRFTGWNMFPLPLGKIIEYGQTYYGSTVEKYNLNFYIQGSTNFGTRLNYAIVDEPLHFKCIYKCSGTLSRDDGSSSYYTNSPYPIIQFQPGNVPGGPGDYTETITIKYDFNDGIDKFITYQVHGKSVADPYMTVTPTSATWPDTVAGNHPTKTFTVKNEGLGLLSGTVTDNAFFTCIDPSPCEFNNLPTGSTTVVTFSFNPVAATPYNFTSTFSSNGNSVNVFLAGRGIYQPVMKITPTTITDPDDYPGDLSFRDIGESNLGASTTQQIRVWNTGKGTLSGTLSFTSGMNFSCHPITTGCSLSILEGTYKDVTIRFAPLTVGVVNDFAQFTSLGTLNAPLTVQVTGKGIFASIINILGSGTNFPATIIGKSKTQNITIKNTGTVDFPPGTFLITTPGYAVSPFQCIASSAGPLVGGLCPYILNHNGSTMITIRFTPTVAGSVNGLISLSGLSLANFFVSGVGIAPSMQFIEK